MGSPVVRPAWSPDGRVLALLEVDTRKNQLHVAFFDVGSGQEIVRENRGNPGGQGLAWLGPDSLVLSAPGTGQRVQLWRMSYRDGAITPLTNDLSSYVGIDLDAARTSLVTSRRDVRTSLFVGDAAGAQLTELAPPTSVGSTLGRVQWVGERIFYDTEINGHNSIAAASARGGSPEEIVPNAFAFGATSTGDTVVFMRPDATGVWKVSGGARQPVRIADGDGFVPIVTPDDRSVIFLSTRGGRQSPWIVPIDGGEPKPITDAFAGADSVRVSPDGRLLLFMTTAENNALSLVVCELPACANRRDLALPPNMTPFTHSWTPDGRAVAYLDQPKMNIWALPLDGAAPYAITHLDVDATNRTIVNFAWSRDGRRLAFLRATTTDDIVLLRLKP